MSAGEITYGLSESDIYQAVRNFLSTFTSLPVINGNQNAPLPPDSLVITMLNRSHKSTVDTRYDKDTGQEISRRTQSADFQVDFYGKDAGQIYDAVLTLGQNATSYELQSEDSPNVQVLYMTERGRQPFTNEQQNYENRYTLEIQFSLWNEIKRKIDFIDNLNIIIKEVK